MHHRILITGGAGFVGSSLAIALKRAHPDSSVLSFDSLKRRGSELNLPRLASAGVTFLHGDVRCPEDFVALPFEPDLIVECSAEPSALSGYDGSAAYLVNTNAGGCFHCLELARRTRADFLFLSTSRVYPYEALNGLAFIENDTRYSLAEYPGGISETFPLDGPRSLYGMTKLVSELMIQEYAAAYGLRAIINRCGLIAGPWQMGKADQGVLTLWMAAHHFRRDLRYIGFGGTGKQVRDFIHIDDLCELLLLQIANLERYSGQIFNLGGGLTHSLSLLELTALCREITGNTVAIAPSQETRPADVRIYITDCGKISAASGWSPRRDARRTLQDIHEWIRSEESRLISILG